MKTSLLLIFLAIPMLAHGGIVNLSLRHSSTPGSTLDVHFELAAASNVLFRNVGPTLANFGVSNTNTDPVLSLFNSGMSLVSSNDDWGNDPAVSALSSVVGAFSLNTSSTDSALAIFLAPGSYTASFSSQASSNGSVLLSEIFTENSSGFSSFSFTATPGTGINAFIGGFINTGPETVALTNGTYVGPGANGASGVSTFVVATPGVVSGSIGVPDTGSTLTLSLAAIFSLLAFRKRIRK